MLNKNNYRLPWFKTFIFYVIERVSYVYLQSDALSLSLCFALLPLSHFCTVVCNLQWDGQWQTVFCAVGHLHFSTGLANKLVFHFELETLTWVWPRYSTMPLLQNRLYKMENIASITFH